MRLADQAGNGQLAASIENEDFKMIEDFNTRTLHFQDFGKCPDLHPYDASGRVGSTYYAIEVKNRPSLTVHDTTQGVYVEVKGQRSQTLMIEQHKLLELLIQYVTKGVTPLYVNFCNGYTIIHNLSRITDVQTRFAGKTKSQIYGHFEMQLKCFLSLEDAAVYDPHGNLIAKPRYKRNIP